MRRVAFCILLMSSMGLTALGQGLGEPSYIKSIYFGGGSFFVDRYQTTELKHFLDSIPNIHNFIITVHSHTDNVGGVEYNEWLSEMRSDSVIELLIENKKIEEGVIEKKDFGLFNPVYDNTTWEGRRRNRRVDIIFWLAI